MLTDLLPTNLIVLSEVSRSISKAGIRKANGHNQCRPRPISHLGSRKPLVKHQGSRLVCCGVHLKWSSAFDGPLSSMHRYELHMFDSHNHLTTDSCLKEERIKVQTFDLAFSPLMA